MPLQSLPQTTNPPDSLLRRYYPILLTGAAVTAAYLTYQLYNSRPQDEDKPQQLHRSNATRRNREHREVPALEHPPTISEADMQRLTSNMDVAWTDGDHFEQAIQEAFGQEAPLTAEEKQNQNLLNLLYHIAEDNAKREGYIHRGVTCNGCGINPIRGIRYRCSNCVDFDLCEHCEAAEGHPKTHLFFKVRIPAPFLGSPRQVFQPWYPGKPNMMANSLEAELSKTLQEEAGLDQPEIDALYEQFKCMAATEFPNDPLRLNGAISRPTFDKCFFPSCGQRPPPPNLIYDRMFEFYDTNGDGLIDFKEFIMGLAALSSKSRVERLRRIFKGYDFDGDGIITRADFLKMFKAYYALQKDLIKDTVAVMEDDVLEPSQMVTHLLGSQPVSAIFTGSIPVGSTRITKQAVQDPDQEYDPVTLPSGTDTLRPGETIGSMGGNRQESQRRTMHRDVGIIGISGSEPPVMFGPGSREMEEGRRVFEHWVEERMNDQDADVARSTAAQASESVGQAQTDEPSSERDPEEVQSTGLPTRTSSLRTSSPPAINGSSFPPLPSSPNHFADQQSPLHHHPYSTTPTSISSHPAYLSDREDTNTHAEILYEITKQGLNELLDLIFKEREREAAEYRKKKEREDKRRRKKEKEAMQAQATKTAAEKKAVEGNGDVATVADIAAVQAVEEKVAVPTPRPTGTSTPLAPPKERKEKRDKSDKENADSAKERRNKSPGDVKREGINYEEFERLMMGENGRKLAFVGAWVEMVSF